MEQESTGELLMAVARSMRGAFGEALATYDVTPGQARALRAAMQTEQTEQTEEPGPVRLSALAQRLRIAPRSATEVVDALEERGLVERTADPADRRAVGVVPTAEGHRLAALLGDARRGASADYLAALDEPDRAELDRILRLLLRARHPD